MRSMMIVSVVGSRKFNDYILLKETLDFYKISKIISGGAEGADSLAERYASENNISITIFKPQWSRYGRSAGFIRNRLIVEGGDILVSFWDSKSKGTKHSIDMAKKMLKEVIIVNF